MKNNISRKRFISASGLAIAGMSLPDNMMAKDAVVENVRNSISKKRMQVDKLKICLFSKHLQWLNYHDMASLVAEMGFDGIDLTVRTGGHVLPERVIQDLPKAVEAVERAGLKVYTLTTGIQEADEPYTESILKTAASLGIKHYRTGWYTYKEALGIQSTIDIVKKRFIGLEKLNSQYGIHGDYQNHMGNYFGASIWDLWLALKDIKTDFIGCQYDIRHATVEGAHTWSRSLQLLHDHIGTIAVKDFYWEKKQHIWEPKDVPIGEGMVDFTQYFEQIKNYPISGPVSMHCEYPLGGAESGAKELSISRQEFVDVVRRDLNTLRSLLKNASLI